MSDLFDEPEGATPLSEEDTEGLIPTWIAARADLNAAEQANIAAATTWAHGRSWKIGDLDQAALKKIHLRMFCDVWSWAGSYRKTLTNIGVDPHLVSPEIENVLRDLRTQTDAEHTHWSPDEVAVRFHHRLAWIHPFANGNGRHARLVADLMAEALSRPRFTWGSNLDLGSPGTARRTYIAALQHADRGDIGPLLDFARR